MWLPPLKFITLHYAWIIFIGLLSFVVIYPYGNLEAVDAYFFGVSSSTESGLNTVDINLLPFYQQLYIYVAPIITSLGFMNIFVVVVRLYWFEKKLGAAGSLNDPARLPSDVDVEAWPTLGTDSSYGRDLKSDGEKAPSNTVGVVPTPENGSVSNDYGGGDVDFSSRVSQAILRIPPPSERDQGRACVEKDVAVPDIEDDGHAGERVSRFGQIRPWRRRPHNKNEGSNLTPGQFLDARFPGLAKHTIIGRRFGGAAKRERERLGGVEYRSLKLLMKVVIAYFFGLHAFGIIALVGWIYQAPAKYTDHLAACGVGKTWWAFYSSQTMVNNLGLTVTPDSMVSFKDATWPLLVMTFLTYAGNTCYPIFLRLILWVMSKLVSSSSSTYESLRFLLDHPRRCYTLLFPSTPTWILFGIVFALNFVDVVLIIALDLNNPAVTDLPLGPRIVSAIFQAGSSRHTGAATMNLGEINPAVQLSLLVMMYIAALPIGISVRASNAYEEKSVGLYKTEEELDENNAKAYIKSHISNQLSFDLWYIFLGTFVICAVESNRVADINDPGFSVFAILFEVVSAYGNVGLSLGHPDVSTSLAGQFKTFSKLVICAAMIRGRHRCLPYALDKAIMLPGEDDRPDGDGDDDDRVGPGSRIVGN
ncbi:cation transporter [Xylaria sp. CBS 124048]|nr:cation transporter [Xylaria sp. CBS 124048]